jgi:hypothetical protein
MQEKYLAIDKIIKQDPGKRNLITKETLNLLEEIVNSLKLGKHVLITTGFFIPEANSIETDGPLGTLLLADSLSSLGIKATIIVEDYAKDIFINASKCLDNKIDFKFLSLNENYSYEDLIDKDVTHFIALERPGSALDGNYYNHKGNSIDKYHYYLDPYFQEARENNIITIGIGDGGNELGLGNMYEYFKTAVLDGEKNCTVTCSDYIVLAGVSNWAGYAIASLLKQTSEINNLYKPSLLDCLLTTIVKYGAVDGIRKKPTKTVDGLVVGFESKILEEINKLIQ